jgi:glycosyltransferase involved in cell wall biosynthesis
MKIGVQPGIVDNKPPLVSVTVCCYNCQEWIDQTIRSVLDQTFTDWELVIINDGSADRTEQIINSFSDPRIIYEYQTNQGLPLARNRSIELSRGKYIAFLDHDDLWEPNKLELQIDLLEQRPDVGLVYSDSHLIGADGQRFGTFFNQWRSSTVPCRGEILKDLLLEGCFIPLLSVVVRKAVLIEVGGFNANYRLAEDYEAWLRIAAGHIVDFIAEPLCSYRVHDANESRIQEERGSEEVLRILSSQFSQPDFSWWFKFRLGIRHAECFRAYIDYLRQKGRWKDSRVLWKKTLSNDPKHMIWSLPLAIGAMPVLLRYTKILYHTLRGNRPGLWPGLLRSLWRQHGVRTSKGGWKTS